MGHADTLNFTVDTDSILEELAAREQIEAAEEELAAQQYREYRERWEKAVAVAFTRAKHKFHTPVFATRLEDGRALVERGSVSFDPNGRIWVQSDQGERGYLMDKKACRCEDVKFQNAPGGYCKHRLAGFIFALANQAMEGEQVSEPEASESANDDPSQPANNGQSAPPPESPISMNTHITIDGRPVQVTVRTGATPDDYHRVLMVMEQVIAEHADAPPSSASPPPAPLQIEAPQGPPPAEAMAQPAAQPSPTPMMKWCALHSVNMKRRGKNGDHWYSHQVGDDWCRGESEAG